MTIFVDELIHYPQAPKAGAERYFGNGKPSCHMTTDGPMEELHQFAESIGLRRSWFQYEPQPWLCHYDLTPSKRALAIRKGAKSEEMMEHIHAMIEQHDKPPAALAPIEQQASLFADLPEPLPIAPKTPRTLSDQEKLHRVSKTNPCVAVYGPGPEGKKCGTCAFLYAPGGTQGTYYKCKKRGTPTGGPGTDHRVRWLACAKYQERSP